MAERSKSQRPQEASAPAVEAAARIAPRRKTADRRLRILERLTNGFSVAHIARAEPLPAPRLRRWSASPAPERRSISPNPARCQVEGKFSASQALEIPRNAEGIPEAALLERLASPDADPAESGPCREPRHFGRRLRAARG